MPRCTARRSGLMKLMTLPRADQADCLLTSGLVCPADLVGDLWGELALPRVRLTGDIWRPSLATAGTRVGLMTLPGRIEASWAWPVRVRGCPGVLC